MGVTFIVLHILQKNIESKNEEQFTFPGGINTESILSSSYKIETSFDFVRIFHQAKPTNPSYGNKNPTILSGSWGAGASPFYNSQEGDTISYNYRGSASSFSFPDVDLTSVPGFVKNALLKIQYPIDNKINNTSYNYIL